MTNLWESRFALFAKFFSQGPFSREFSGFLVAVWFHLCSIHLNSSTHKNPSFVFSSTQIVSALSFKKVTNLWESRFTLFAYLRSYYNLFFFVTGRSTLSHTITFCHSVLRCSTSFRYTIPPAVLRILVPILRLLHILKKVEIEIRETHSCNSTYDTSWRYSFYLLDCCKAFIV